MAHKLECLNRRDRYMIGDWYMEEGKPYQWTVNDYNRTPVQMEHVKDIPLTEEILKANGFVIDEDNKNLTAYLYGKKDANGYKISPYAHVVYGKYPNDFHFDVVGEYRQVKGNRFHYVHELQHALRLCELKNLANNFKLKKQ